jgi:TPR repeat protein
MAGLGVARDPAAAEALLLAAAGRGEPHAPAALAELYALHWPEPDPERARTWLARAERGGDRLAELVRARLPPAVAERTAPPPATGPPSTLPCADRFGGEPR